VEPLATSDYPTAAPRPAYSVLASHAWAALGEAPLPAWRAGLRAYLAERGSTSSVPAGA
jgi:dTDP-4-dehydrorhamnose reductase